MQVPGKDLAQEASFQSKDSLPESQKHSNILHQLGHYSLCYRKIAVYTSSNPSRLVLLSGSQDFSNEKFQVLVFKGYKHKSDPLSLQERSLNIPRGNRDRRDELVEGLRFFLEDPLISFKFMAFGLAGMIKFGQYYHALFILDISQIGKILDHEIYQINKWRVEPLFHSKSPGADIEEREIKHIRNYLETETNKFYFSYTYDMTHNLQDNFCYSLEKNKDLKQKFESKDYPLFKWNDHCARHFAEAGSNSIPTDKWIIKMIHGYYEEMLVDLFGNLISIHVISRRLIQNAGTRYNRRGLNPEGFPANFVETEQIVSNLTISSPIRPSITSFVQVRGSVPLYWFQKPGIFTPKPIIEINQVDARLAGAGKHFSDLLGLYGKNVYCLNLMKCRPHRKSNKEEVLSEQYQALMAKMTALDDNFTCLEYNHIDLKNSIKEDQDNFFNIAFKLAEELNQAHGCFSLDGFSSLCESHELKVSYQRGITRLNCVDCLDRTNFMMNLLADTCLLSQLKIVLQAENLTKVEVGKGLAQGYQNIWRNTGDNIALQYGGSKAHQQKDSNLAQVAYQSVKRHWTNTFKDNLKQYQISLFLGDYLLDGPWELKISATFRPSQALIHRLQEGELYGGAQKEFYTKIQLKEGETETDSFVVPIEYIFSQAVRQPFREILLKPKLFENRKNIVAELTDKRIIQGTEQFVGEDDYFLLKEDLVQPDKLTYPLDEEMKKQAEEIQKQLTEVNSFTDQKAISVFLRLNQEYSKTKTVDYKKLKESCYSELENCNTSEKEEFEKAAQEMYTENLLEKIDYNDFLVLEKRPEVILEKENKTSRSKKRVTKIVSFLEPEPKKPKKPEGVKPNTNVINPEVKQIIQCLPNAIKNRVNTF